MANEPKRFLSIENAGHTDAWSHGGDRFVMKFLVEIQASGLAMN